MSPESTEEDTFINAACDATLPIKRATRNRSGQMTRSTRSHCSNLEHVPHSMFRSVFPGVPSSEKWRLCEAHLQKHNQEADHVANMGAEGVSIVIVETPCTIPIHGKRYEGFGTAAKKKGKRECA